MNTSQIEREMRQLIVYLTVNAPENVTVNATLAQLGFNASGIANMATHIDAHFANIGYPLSPAFHLKEMGESMTFGELCEIIAARIQE